MAFKKDSKDLGNKILYEVVDPYFLQQMAVVLTYGARKYGLNNWKSAAQKELHHYEGAIFRHMQSYRMGEFVDPDHNQSHLASVAVNSMFLDYFRRKYQWGLGHV